MADAIDSAPGVIIGQPSLNGRVPGRLGDEDGQDHDVQYFERARFELHPNNGRPFDVLLGQLGREVLEL